MKKTLWFKTISLVLVVAFLSLDAAWAYPPGQNTPKRYDLAAQSIFHEKMSGDGKARQADIFREAELAGSIVSIATILFRDRIPVYWLEPTLEAELKTLPQGIDLSEVTAAIIKDGRIDPISLTDKEPVPPDCVIVVPYNKDNANYYIHIARKDSPAASRLAGKAWPISDLYEIRVVPEHGTKVESDLAGEETAVQEFPEAATAAEQADSSANKERPKSVDLHGFDLTLILTGLASAFEKLHNLMSEYPYVSASIGAGIGIVTGILLYRKISSAGKKKADTEHAAAGDAGAASKEQKTDKITGALHMAVAELKPDKAIGASSTITQQDLERILGISKTTVAKQKSALVIGAGRIGRGLIGKFLNDSGYAISFVVRDRELADRLNRDKGYNLNIVGNDKKTVTKRIDKVSAIRRSDAEAVTASIANTDTIFVAVFDQDFEDVSLMVAKGIEKRLEGGLKRPLNVIVVSNRFSTKHVIRDTILRNVLPTMRTDADALLGVVDTATFNIIPDVPELLAKKDPTLMQIYGDVQLEADSGGFRGELINIPGINMKMSENIRQIKLRKLFVYNGAHAICAYLGRLKGYKFIHDAVKDEAIREVLDAAFNEMRGLLGDWLDYDDFTRMVISGLSDPRYNDEIDRVAKDPIRKLSDFDRLVSPAKLAMRKGRIPHAYAMGIAAALLYDNPDDAQAMEIQAKLAEDKSLNTVLRDICGLSYDYDAKLMGLITEKLAIVRKEKAKAYLASYMEKGYLGDESYYDKAVQVAGRLPKKVKLVVWDFDNVVGNTQKFYTEATAIVYWRIRNGIKEADAMPLETDPIYKEGKELYHSFLAEGPATFRTIQTAIKSAKKDGRPDSELLSESEYYRQFTALRESMFSVLEPADFFHPGMRELLCTIRALNPDVEFCINTALEESFFNHQFTKPGFRGYFSFAKALTETQRNTGNTDRAKAENLEALINERRVSDEEVIVIDDSSKFMDIIKDRAVFKIGVATNTGSGMELIDRGVNAVFMNMKPTPEKLMMFGLDKEKAGTINSVAPDVYLIRSKPEALNQSGKIDPYIDDMIKRDIDMPVVATPEMRKKLEDAFESRVRSGAIEPNVIVNIKDFSPNAVAVYMEELKRISEYYNGNVTFVLVVESNINAFQNDMPSTFSAVAKAKAALGDRFRKGCTMMIADGGRKIRNMPLTLLYLYEGLMPYSYGQDNRIRLHEVFVRTGGLMMQMPEYGARHVAIVGSDSIFDSENISMHDGRPLSSSGHGIVVVPEVEIPEAKTKDLSSKIVRAADPEQKDKTRYVLAKPDAGLTQRYESKYKGSVHYGLHFLTIWKKVGLNSFLKKMQNSKELMENGRPFLEMPCDMFMLFFQSVSMPEEEWLELKPAGVSEKDWKKGRKISIDIFGKELEKVEFARMDAKKAFIDEGILKTSLPRFSELVRDDTNIVKKSPKVQLSNATSVSMDRVIIKGKGKIIFGRDVKLKDVIIELNGETLQIPDRWTIKNAYLKGDCIFEGINSYLEGSPRPEQPGYLLDGISFKDGAIEPLKGETFPANTVSTVVSRLHGKPVTVTIPIGASRELLGRLKFDGRDLLGLQVDTDICANRKKTAELEKIIEKEFSGAPGIFPLTKDAISQDASKATYSAAVKKIVSHITEGKAASPGKQYWVTIEGIQGAGKTHLIEDLRKALGKRVVVIEEDWYHLSREARNAEVKLLTEMGVKTRVHHAENWHDWKKLRLDIERIRSVGSGSGRVLLEELYNRDMGGMLTRTEPLDIAPDTIFIYSGFYVSDKGKVDVPSDCSIYIGINQEESLSIKLGRDKWRTPQDVYALDNTIYRPAFEQYIATYDPAAAADIVLSYDNVRDRSKVSIVTGIPVYSKRAKAKRLNEIEDDVINIRARFERAGKGAINLLHDAEFPKESLTDIAFDTKMPAAAMKQMAKKLIAAVSALDKAKLPDYLAEDISFLEKNLERIESDSIMASLIIKARQAKREGKKFIIGIETDWIPGFDDKRSLQHMAAGSLVKNIDALASVLRVFNLEDSVEVIHSNSKDLVRDIMNSVGNNTARLSNVVVLASKKTVDSEGFNVLKSTPQETRAFIAVIDTTELDNWYSKSGNKDSTRQPDIELVEMLSIALELSLKESASVSDIPLIVNYDSSQRIVVFLPKAVPEDINDLKKKYDLQIGALRRMA